MTDPPPRSTEAARAARILYVSDVDHTLLRSDGTLGEDAPIAVEPQHRGRIGRRLIALPAGGSIGSQLDHLRSNAMGNLSIRRLDEETIRRLRLRAARNGLSMEEETRRIIRQAVATPERIGDLAVQLFGPAH